MWESLSDCTILFNLQTGQVHGLLDHGLFWVDGQQWTTVDNSDHAQEKMFWSIIFWILGEFCCR